MDIFIIDMNLLNYLISLFPEGKIVHKINNLPTFRFAGMTGTVMIDDKGDRDPDYWMWSFGPGQEQYEPFMKILLTKPPGQQVRRRDFQFFVLTTSSIFCWNTLKDVLADCFKLEKYIFKLILVILRFREYGTTWMLRHTGGRLTINLRATFQPAACPTSSVLKTQQVCTLNLLRMVYISCFKCSR